VVNRWISLEKTLKKKKNLKKKITQKQRGSYQNPNEVPTLQKITKTKRL
jgi:hypothetical protein